jgi:putative GTP pyrophosphokinase
MNTTRQADIKNICLENFDAISEEYRENALLYHNFCSTMQNLMINLLDNKGFKYQLASRIKSLDSIKEKMLRNYEKGKTYKKLNDVEDLVGIRIIFYLESDKRRFVNVVSREFTPGRLKIEEHRKEKGYRSIHIQVQLGKKRLVLNEYCKFAGLKCELQLTSALFHAWSEIEHDIFYKRNLHLEKNEPELFFALKQELEDVMTKYVVSASDTFESIALKIQKVHSKK